jgi:hypothetical protein
MIECRPPCTTSANTSLQTSAEQSNSVALSSPQGETLPPVGTFESRKRRIRRGPVTSRGGFENGVGQRLRRTSFRSVQRRRDCGPQGSIAGRSSDVRPARLRRVLTCSQSCSKRCCSGRRIRPSPRRRTAKGAPFPKPRSSRNCLGTVSWPFSPILEVLRCELDRVNFGDVFAPFGDFLWNACNS